MARPIAATPTLYGEDARKFIEEMKKPPTPEHIAHLKRAKKVYESIKVHRVSE
jgi:hypothetical protein